VHFTRGQLTHSDIKTY